MDTITGLSILRFALAIIFLSHGVARIWANGVHPFGELFLNQIGFSPIGVPIAWSITLLELIGSVLLIANKWTKLVSYWFIFQIAIGIALVHFKEGWFVVGLGRNGFEYSFLIICSLIAINFSTGFRWENPLKS
jgi:putative oxidoreductase